MSTLNFSSITSSRTWTCSTRPTSSSRCGPKASDTSRTHSRAAGASAMRGAGMVTEAAVVRPAASTSETSGGKSMAQVFMASASASSTMLTTKDPAAPMCRVVSFGEWSGLCCRPSTTSGGASENTLKNEKGAAFTTPPGPSVETSAMGRGTTSEQRIL